VPWIIVIIEEFETRLKAREREKYLKTGVGREFIKTLLNS
jgi:putative endonuclease